MTGTRKNLVLAKLAKDSRCELKAMTAELSGLKPETKMATPELAFPTKAFSASGKILPPP